MREAGNDSYRKERHALKACDLYTEAIFLAPSQDSIAAAMAHANRSTVLHDCGMYEVRPQNQFHTKIQQKKITCKHSHSHFSTEANNNNFFSHIKCVASSKLEEICNAYEGDDY